MDIKGPEVHGSIRTKAFEMSRCIALIFDIQRIASLCQVGIYISYYIINIGPKPFDLLIAFSPGDSET